MSGQIDITDATAPDARLAAALDSGRARLKGAARRRFEATTALLLSVEGLAATDNWLPDLADRGAKRLGIEEGWAELSQALLQDRADLSGLMQGLYFCGLAAGMTSDVVGAILGRDRSTIIGSARRLALTLGWWSGPSAQLPAFAAGLGLSFPPVTAAMLATRAQRVPRTRFARGVVSTQKSRAKLRALVMELGWGLTKSAAARQLDMPPGAFDKFLARSCIDFCDLLGWNIYAVTIGHLTGRQARAVRALHRRNRTAARAPVADEITCLPVAALDAALASAVMLAVQDQARAQINQQKGRALIEALPGAGTHTVTRNGVRRMVHTRARKYLPPDFGDTLKQTSVRVAR